MRDEVSDPTFVVEFDNLAAGALVGQDDPQATREERRLAQPLLQRFGRELQLLEDLRVGQERDRRPRVAVVRVADHCQIRVGDAAREFLAVELAVAAHFGDQPFGQRVDDGHTHAVEPARHLVRRAVRAELAAGVQLRQNHGERRRSLVFHQVDRNARAVVRTVTELSGWRVTSILSLRPARASSTLLSTTS